MSNASDFYGDVPEGRQDFPLDRDTLEGARAFARIGQRRTFIIKTLAVTFTAAAIAGSCLAWMHHAHKDNNGPPLPQGFSANTILGPRF